MAFDKIFLLLVIFGCSLAFGISLTNDVDDNIGDIPDDDDDYTTGEEAAPCCLPDVWTGTLQAEVGLAKARRLVGGRDQVFIDRKNFRLAGKKHPFGKGNLTFSYIVLFNDSANSSVLYAFDEAKQKCVERKFQKVHFRQACIPKNATLHGTFVLGLAGTTLSVQSWGISHKDRREDSSNDDLDRRPHPKPTQKPKPRPRPHRRGGFLGNLLVVPGQCVPVLFQYAGSGFGGFVGSTYFHDVQTTIKTPTVFTPPAYCKKPQQQLIFGLDDTEDIIPSTISQLFIEQEM